MQDQYAGDIGDYGKFGMLRMLAAQGLRIGINWYKVEPLESDHKRLDGNKLIPERLFACDRPLAKMLSAISRSDSRSISMLEDAALVPQAIYYSKTVPVDNRLAWHTAALSKLSEAGLVFLDPDNGLLVKSVGRRSIRAPKYAFYEEVADYVSRGQSVVVYNHRSRKKASDYFTEIHERLIEAVPQATGVSAITYPRGSVRDYFAISASSEHEARIERGFKILTSGRWGQAGMCRLQALPDLAYIEP